MERNAANYISFMKTLGSLLYYTPRHPDPVDRKEYRQKYELLKERESEFNMQDLTLEKQQEITKLNHLIYLYDQYNSEMSDMRKSEIFCEIMDLFNQMDLVHG